MEKQCSRTEQCFLCAVIDLELKKKKKKTAPQARMHQLFVYYSPKHPLKIMEVNNNSDHL